MPRAIWKGSISFGLVNIPVGLYSATKPANEIKFRMLRDKDQSPIRYKRIAEADEKEVPWENIVKGYEYEKGRFIVLNEEDFRRADIEATQTVEIMQFVNLKEIDPMFFDKPYYLEPQKNGAKAYALLREALNRSGKVGIAKVVIKTRQHLAAIKPEGKALVLEIMHFAEELVEPTALEMPAKVDVGSKELDMASELIEQMTAPWQPEKFQDEYRHALMGLIEKKIESGGRAPAAASEPKRHPTKVIDLVSVLQESLKEAGKAGTAHRKHIAHKRKAPLKKAA
jgi:DNA end-binding protein Ku